MMFNLFRCRRYDVLPYDSAMRLLRVLAYGGSPNRKAMRALATQAVASAPTAQERRHAERWLQTFQRGHRLKIGTYAATFYTNGETAALDDELADAMKDVEVPPGFKGDDDR